MHVDSYGSHPYLLGGSYTRAMRIPDLDRTTEPKIGTTLKFRVVALPADTIMLAGAHVDVDAVESCPPFSGNLRPASGPRGSTEICLYIRIPLIERLDQGLSRPSSRRPPD